MITRVIRTLYAPRDIASLAAFRALFGLLMAASVARFVAKGWVDTQLIQPAFHFTYPGLGFIQPWPGTLMYWHFALMFLAALGVALGLWFRASAVLFFLSFTYAELIDRANYLNHYYLVSLLAALLAVSPAGRAFALDTWLRPERRLEQVPRFMLLALRWQVGVVYAFAGLAKLNHDWLIEAQPLRTWLAARSDLPWLGPFLQLPAAAHLASWAGAAFDLAIVPLLCFPRTRRAAFALALLFHALTALLFPIGLFPWIMSACATLFFAPSWPRRWLPSAPPSAAEETRHSRVLCALLGLHALVQLAVPLTLQLAYRDSAWTHRGFDFCWKVMLIEKVGHVELFAHAPDRRPERVGTRELAAWQERAMAQDPELIRAFALHLARGYRRQVAITADAVASLNGRPASPLLDPAVDLTQPLPAGWILPLP